MSGHDRRNAQQGQATCPLVALWTLGRSSSDCIERAARLRELEAEKTVLAGRYELELRRLRETPEIVAGLDGDARRLLEAGMREFQAAVRVNADRLAQARGVVEDVARTIARSLAADRGPASYARDAAPDHGARVVPMAFDRRC